MIGRLVLFFLTMISGLSIAQTAIIEFTQPEHVVNEDVGTIVVEIVRSGVTQGTATAQVSTQVPQTDPATPESDFNSLTKTVVFDDGVTSQTVTLTILEDAIQETDEWFGLVLSEPGAGTTLGQITTAAIKIVDNDAPPNDAVVSLDKASYSVFEDDTSFSIRVLRSGNLDVSAGVTLIARAFPARVNATESEDFEPVNIFVDFSSGATERFVPIAIHNDQVTESPEDFEVVLVEPITGTVLGQIPGGSVTINDPEITAPAGEIQFTQTSYAGPESTTSFFVEVERVNGTQGSISAVITSVTIPQRIGTATEGTDYQAVNQTVTFADGVGGTQSIPIIFLDDSDAEGDEHFGVMISSNNPGQQTEAEVVIQDDDQVQSQPGEIMFSSANYTVNEGDSALVATLERVQGSDGAASVSFTTFPNQSGANPGEDFVAIEQQTISWTDGDSSPKTVSITIIDDQIQEGNETFILDITDPIGASIGSIFQATAEIIDNDQAQGGILAFGGTVFEGNESDGFINVTILRDGGTDGELNAVLVPRAITSRVTDPASPETDFSVASISVSFPAGNGDPQQIPVPIVDDREAENTEAFFVDLMDPNNNLIASAELNIVDNDGQAESGQARFVSQSYQVLEDGGTVTVTVERINGTTGPLTVNIATFESGDTSAATSGADYSPISETITFADGDATPVNITIPITDDTETEGPESFGVELTATDPAHLGQPFQAFVVIDDNDTQQEPSGSLSLVGDFFQVPEDAGSMTVQIQRLEGSAGRLEVKLRSETVSTGPAATPGEDYTEVLETVVFEDGDTTPKDVVITILNDTAEEGDEFFDIFLDGLEVPLAHPSRASVLIEDDDSTQSNPEVGFEATEYLGNEGIGAITVTLARSGDTSTGIEITVFTIEDDGSNTPHPATAGEDFQAVQEVVAFAPGETGPVSISIPIIDDSIAEETEVFGVAISGPSGRVSPQAAVIIEDNDQTPTETGLVSFVSTQFSVHEDASTLMVTVQRTQGSSGELVGTISTGAPTGAAGQFSPADPSADFTEISETFTFADGETTPKDFTIPINDDQDPEDSEFFGVFITTTDANALGSPNRADVEIIDNDGDTNGGSVIRLMSSAFQIGEGEQALVVEVERSGEPTGAITGIIATVPLIDTSGTFPPATPGEDFTPIEESFTFQDGEGGIKSFTIPILEDTVNEGPEFFDLAIVTNDANHLGSPNQASVEIIDNEDVSTGSGEIHFASSRASVTEDGITIDLEVLRSGGTTGELTATLSTRELQIAGGAKADEDFTPVTTTITFQDGDDAPQIHAIPIIDDEEFEENEQFIAVLSGDHVGQLNEVVINIFDNDDADTGIPEFTNSQVVVSEGDGTANLELIRVGGNSGRMGMLVATVAGSADRDVDYEFFSQNIEWGDGDATPIPISINIIDDNESEGPEEFRVEVRDPLDPSTTVSATVIIEDNDESQSSGFLVLSNQEYRVGEAEPFVEITVERKEGSNGELVASFRTLAPAATDGATPGEDYETVETTITFPDGDQTPQTIQVPIIDDTEVEGSEGFSVELSGEPDVVQSPNQAIVIIQDDDDDTGPGNDRARFEVREHSISEDGGQITLEIIRESDPSGPPPGPMSVFISTAPDPNGQPAIPGEDYEEFGAQLDFPEGDLGPLTITIGIIDDQEEEGPESFEVNIEGPDGTLHDTAKVLIIDNDGSSTSEGFIAFSKGVFEINEGDPFATVEVIRQQGSAGVATAQVITSPGSADPGLDYEETTTTVTFQDGDAGPIFIEIPMIDDNEVEGEEAFTVELIDDGTAKAVGSPSIAEVIITDNDVLNSGKVRFTSPAFTASEGQGFLTIEVERFESAEGDLEITLSTKPVQFGSPATPNVDYESTTQSIIWADGVSGPQTVDISILNDDDIEDEETFAVILEGPGEVLGRPSQALATILEDDQGQRGRLTFDSQGYQGVEGDTITVAVVREGGSDGELSAMLVSQDFAGGAIESLDYDAIQIEVFFADGDDTPQFFDIFLIDDDEQEEPESFGLQLQDDTAGSNPPRALVRIEDNDLPDEPGRIDFTRPTVQIGEEEGEVIVSVERHDGDAGELSAVLFTSTATDLGNPSSPRATSGEDFEETTVTVTFADGEAGVKTISIPILDDTSVEDPPEVFFVLKDEVGKMEPPPFLTVVINDNDLMNTRIISPQPAERVLTNTEILFEAEVIGAPEGEEVLFRWEICTSTGDCFVIIDNNYLHSFDVDAAYEITCRAIATNTEDSTPARQPLRVDTEEKVRARIVEPETTDKTMETTPGEPVFFTAEVTPAGATISWFYLSSPNDVTTGSDTFQDQYDEEGIYVLVLEATTESGQKVSDHIRIVVSETTVFDVEILSPENEANITVGETVDLQGIVDENTIAKADDLSLTWIIEGNTLSGEAPSYTFNEPGRKRIVLFATSEGKRIEDSIIVFVEDPATPPVVAIDPPTDIELEPGDDVRFRAVVRRDTGYRPEDLNFEWDFGNGETSTLPSPGRIAYDEAGVYTVTLFAKVADTGQQSETVTRTITVRETQDADFEPNETFEEASPLTPGNYNNLGLDDTSSVDVFTLTIDSAGQRIELVVTATSATLVEVFDANQNLIQEDTITGQETVILTGLAPGNYFIRLSAVDVNALSKASLGYNLSISVLNPALYFPNIKEDGSNQTQLGIVNPTGSLSEIEVLGYDAAGNLIDSAQLEIAANGRAHQSIEEIFGDNASEIAWVQVDSTSELRGYTRTESRDFKEVFATSAAQRLSTELYVPHIAKDTTAWFTEASVVNGSDRSLTSKLQTPGVEQDLNLNKGYSQESIDFLERLGVDGELPETSQWATFKDTEEQASLAGSEVFGTNNSNPDERYSAGLELVDVRQDNPNFTYVGNNLYFTHIARDTGQFWTGLALVNIGDIEQAVLVKAYGPDGTQLPDTKTITLAPNEKIVTLADTFLDGIGSPANVDWVLVEADNNIAGFELFGTWDRKRIAGLEASTALKKELCFPFIDTSTDVVHGIALINVQDSATNVTFTLYDDQGVSLGEVTRSLNATQKLTFLVESLFDVGSFDEGQIPGWLSITADQPLAGFELFVNINSQEQMGALIAQ